MLAGATLCLFSSNLSRVVSKITSASLLQLFSFLVVIVSVFLVPLYSVNSWTPYVSLLTVIATLLVLALNTNNSILKLSYFEYIGKSSYSIYLWHWPLIIFALRLDLSISLSNLLVLLLVLTFVSFVSYRYVEKVRFNFKFALLLFVLAYLSGLEITKTDGSNYLKSTW